MPIIHTLRSSALLNENVCPQPHHMSNSYSVMWHRSETWSSHWHPQTSITSLPQRTCLYHNSSFLPSRTSLMNVGSYKSQKEKWFPTRTGSADAPGAGAREGQGSACVTVQGEDKS